LARSGAKRADQRRAAIERERAQFVDTVGTEISAIWRNVTRLGGQVVASLYLWDEPRSMDDLSEELGRSKSNVFANLKALQSLGIVRRVSIPGSARDHFELAAEYPDVLVVAFARHLSHTLRDKSTELRAIAERLDQVAEEEHEDAVVRRVRRIGETYAAVGELIDSLLPEAGKPTDLLSILGRINTTLIKRVIALIKAQRG